MHVLAYLVHAQFVGLRKHDGKGDAVLAKKTGELQINLLGRDARVDEQEEAYQTLAARDVVLNHLLQLGRGLLAALGIAVAREVHQMPLAVDAEMVDEHRLARRGGGHGQILSARQHIDKATLADIAAADKGIFRKGRGGTLLHATATNYKFSTLDIHI